MTAYPRILAAALAGAAAAATSPAAAQTYPYPYPYPQQYPQQYPGQTYPYPGQTYPYGGTVVDQVIGQLLGNRYNVNDRSAVSRCANAAISQAQNQYRGYGTYGVLNPFGQGAVGSPMRVTAITEVDRRSDGLRVRGLLDSGMSGYNPNPYNQSIAWGDLTFRCTVDYRGYVTNVRVRPNDNWQRRY